MSKPDPRHELAALTKLGARIDNAARLVGTRREAADAMGITSQHLHRLIAGASSPSLQSVIRLAKAANVDLNWLATGDGTPHPNRRGRMFGLAAPERNHHMTELNITPHERLIIATSLIDSRAASVDECIEILRRCSQFVYKEQDPARALVEWFSARTTRHLEAISKLARVHHTPEMLAHWVMTGEGSPFFDLLAVCHRYANHSRVPSDGLLDDLATAAERACSYAP